LGSAAILAEIEAQGRSVRYLDVGGGLGIPYQDETPPQPKAYAHALLTELDGLPQTLILEPGRAIVGNAGILVTRLLYSKETPEKRFYVVDAAMNDLTRPSLYQAYHEILPVAAADAPKEPTDVVGPICETGDFLARGRPLPSLPQGSLLAVMSAGAYGFTMSSNYNSRPRVAEVMVRGDRFAVVRRRETYARLVQGETIPDFKRHA
jgi:diaminopimelate decarboxylase